MSVKIYRWLFPAGSKRDSALRILKHEGVMALVQRGYEKIMRIINKRDVMPFKPTGKLVVNPPAGKPDILCFSIIDWDFRFQRPQQLLTQFAKNGHRVFYMGVKFKGLVDAVVDLHPINNNIYEMILPGDTSTVIYYNDMSDETLNCSFLALVKFFKDENLLNTICMVQHPFWTPLVRRLKEQFDCKVIYDCMDDHSGFEVTHSEMAAREEALFAISDLVIATSQLLYSRISKVHKNCTLIPNAGDFEYFNHIPARETGSLSKLSKPVIGYYGAIAEWFDTNALYHAAIKHPEWSFAMIGHTTGVDIRELKRLKNVSFLGEKKYSDLPSYLTSFDVCTIPFRRTPLTEATNPVKVFEYLSTGKPVVAASLPELLPLQDVVYLYSTPEEFTQQLEQALEVDCAELREQRINLARENTWLIRYQTLQSNMASLYGKASIIIITWNNLEHTQKCIQSVLADQTWPNFELIIVDNASTDGTTDYLKELSDRYANVHLILNEENFGFAAGNNLGLQQAQGSEYIALLNNDTVVPIGWLARLLRHLKDPAIGMIGPVTNSIGNEARIDVPYQNVEEMHGFAREYMVAHDGEIFDISMLAMYCVVLQKDVFEKVGFLDERFGIGMFEDDDYARRVREKGYRIVCAEDVFVHHVGRASFSKLNSSEYRQLFDKNISLFEEKWNTKWTPHKRSKFRQT